MRRVRIDGLVEWEVGRVVVESGVHARVGRSDRRLGETGDKLLEEAFTLRSSHGRTGTVVVIKADIVIILIVFEIFLSEETTERRVAECISLVRTKLEHINDIGRVKLDTVNVALESGDGAVESLLGECGSSSRAEGTARCDVGVGTCLVWCTSIVHARCLYHEFNAYLIEVLGNAKEASSKVFSSLDHTILLGTRLVICVTFMIMSIKKTAATYLTLSSEYGQSTLLSKVVQQFPILLSESHSKLKILQPSKRSQKLSAKLISPRVEEAKITRGVETPALGGGSGKLGCKSGRTSARSGVSSAMSVEQVYLGDGAAVRDERRSIIEAVKAGRDRVPRREVTPVFEHVKVPRAAVIGLVGHKRVVVGSAVVVSVGGSGSSSSRFNTSHSRPRVTNDRFGREELGVDAGFKF